MGSKRSLFLYALVLTVSLAPGLAGGGSLAVLPFALTDSEPGWEWFSQVGARETLYALSKSVLTEWETIPMEKVLSVLPGEAAQGNLNDETLKLVLEKLDKPTLVIGYAVFSKDSVTLEAQVFHPDTNRPKRIAWVQGSIDSLPILLHYVSKEITKEFGGAYSGKSPLFARETVPIRSEILRTYFEAMGEIEAGNDNRALALLDQLAKECPEHLGSRLARADLLFSTGKTEEAIPILSSLVEVLPLLESRIQVAQMLDDAHQKAGSPLEEIRNLWKGIVDHAYKTLPKDSIEEAERGWEKDFRNAVEAKSGKIVLPDGRTAEKRPLALRSYSSSLRSPFAKSPAERHIGFTRLSVKRLAECFVREKNYARAADCIEAFLTIYPADYRRLRGSGDENEDLAAYLLDVVAESVRETGAAPDLKNGMVHLSPESSTFEETYDPDTRAGNLWSAGISTLIRETTGEQRYVSKDPDRTAIIEEERDIYLFASDRGDWITNVEIEGGGKGGARIRLWPCSGSSDPLQPQASSVHEISFPGSEWQSRRESVVLPSGVSLLVVETGGSGKPGEEFALLPWSLRAAIKPAEAPGSLVITSDPSGIPISVDGLKRGETPLTLSSVIVGSHEVRAHQPYFRFQQKVAQVRSGEETSVHFVMETFSNPVELAREHRKGFGWSDPVELVPAEKFGAGNPFSMVLNRDDEMAIVWSWEKDLWMWKGTLSTPGRAVRLEAPISSSESDHSPMIVLTKDKVYTLSWLSERGGGATERRWVSTSLDATAWSEPERDDRYFPPYRSIRFGQQTFKEGPALVAAPTGGIMMYGSLTEDGESSTADKPVARVLGRPNPDGKGWAAVREVLKAEVPAGKMGFPLLFGPYAACGLDGILMSYKCHASPTTGFYATFSNDGFSFAAPYLLYETKTHGIYDTGAPLPLVLRDGTQVIYWREAKRISELPGEPAANVVRLAVRPRAQDWTVLDESPLLFAGAIGKVELVETSAGEGILLYDDEGTLRAITHESLRNALRM